MQSFPPEWVLFRGRRVIRVPARYYSRLIGMILFALMAILCLILVVIQDITFFVFRFLIALLVGFLFACGWGVSFPYRTLVINKNRIDMLYMLFHLSIEYLFIFGVLSFPFFEFDSVWCALGAIVFHFLDINIHAKRWDKRSRREDI